MLRGGRVGILWMDEILHHLRHPGTMIPLQIPTNNYFAWFLSGAKWISSIHSTSGSDWSTPLSAIGRSDADHGKVGAWSVT